MSTYARPLRLGLGAVALLILWIAGSANAQGNEPTDDQVNAIAKQLYCPVCENVPLDVCPTQACEQWRETIRQMLAEGKTPEQIRQFFVEQYGARVLATPPPTGLNWLVYVLPPLAIVGGGIVLWRALRSWKRIASKAPAGAIEPEDPYIARLEQELRRRGS